MIVRELITLLGFKTDESALKNAERRVRVTADRMVAAGQKMSLFLTLPLLAAGTGMLKAASDATELQNKFNQVFRGMTDDANAWAEGFAKSVGKSRFAVKESLSTFQSFFVGMGFGQDEAAKMSKQMQELSTDFGSFNNIADAEASQRFISAMSGSAEVLDRFGINLKASALDIELVNLGLAKSTAKANEQQKAVARLSLIQKALTQQGALGDAVRTLDEFANRLRAVTARIRDVAVSFGAQLLPWMNRLLGVGIPVLEWLDGLSASSKRYILIAGMLVAAIGPLVLFGGQMLKLFLMLNGPMLAIVAVGALLALIFEDIVTWIQGGDSLIGTFAGSWEDFQARMMPIFELLKLWFGTNLPIMFNNLKDILLNVVVPAVIEWANLIWGVVGPLVMGIIDLAKLFWKMLVGLWEAFGPVIIAAIKSFAKLAVDVGTKVLSGIMSVVKGVMKIIGGLLRFIGGVFTGQWKEAWEGIKDVFQGIWDIIIGQLGVFFATIKGVFGVIGRVFKFGSKAAGAAIKEIPSAVKTVATAALITGTALADSGDNINADKFAQATQNTVNSAKTIQLQPIVSVEVGSVNSPEAAQEVADRTSKAVAEGIEKAARDIQTSLPEVE